MTKSVQEQKVDLFRRTYNLEQEIIQAKELQKDLKDEFTYHKELNTSGLHKDVVKKVIRAAKAKASQDDLKTKAAELVEIDEIISELEG